MSRWQEDEKVKEDIYQLSRIEMARLWRYAPPGHSYFDDEKPFYEVFKKRFFEELGGFTPAISKMIDSQHSVSAANAVNANKDGESDYEK